HLLKSADQQRREVLALFLKPSSDGRVVAGGVGEGLGRKALAGNGGQAPVAGAKLVEHGVVARRADHRSGEGAVLGRRAEHGWATDVDVLYHLVLGGSTDGRGALEGVEVDDHQVDQLDVVLLDGGDVLGVVANGQQPGVQLGVQRLDAAVHDLRKPS